MIGVRPETPAATSLPERSASPRSWTRRHSAPCRSRQRDRSRSSDSSRGACPTRGSARGRCSRLPAAAAIRQDHEAGRGETCRRSAVPFLITKPAFVAITSSSRFPSSRRARRRAARRHLRRTPQRCRSRSRRHRRTSPADRGPARRCVASPGHSAKPEPRDAQPAGPDGASFHGGDLNGRGPAARGRLLRCLACASGSTSAIWWAPRIQPAS